MSEFYAGYGEFKDYTTPTLQPKHIRRLDREFWGPTACSPDMAVLEVGCGTGLFLAYLKAKGVHDFLGIDQDSELAPHIPGDVAGHFRVVDVWAFLKDGAGGRTFDRIVLFDVLEHFEPEDGRRLLEGLGAVLRPGGRILLKVPNAGSPWGAQYQYGDLTHKTAFTPSSLRQIAIASGLHCTRCFPHQEGSPSRRILDSLLQRVLNRFLMSPPEIWTANVFALLERPEA